MQLVYSGSSVILADGCKNNTLEGSKISLGPNICGYHTPSGSNFSGSDIYLGTGEYYTETISVDTYLKCGNGKYTVIDSGVPAGTPVTVYLDSVAYSYSAEVFIINGNSAEGNPIWIKSDSQFLGYVDKIVLQPGESCNLYCASDMWMWSKGSGGGAGSGATVITQINSNTVATSVSTRYLANAASGAITVTLPDATTSNGNEITVKKIDTSANTITISPVSPNLIEGSSASIILTTQNQTIVAVCDGTNWYLI